HGGLKTKANKASFLIEEKYIYDSFFKLRSDEKDIESKLKSQASNFVGGSLEDLYYILQKVSPFVYQFIGIKKDLLDSVIALASDCKLDLAAVLPNSFIFARYAGTYNPFFFVFKGIDESTLVASEYGGVYFSGTYTTNAEINSKMTSLISELSSLNREKPVTEVKYIGEEIRLDPPFVATKLELPKEVRKGFERLYVTYELLNRPGEEVINNYFNLLGFIAKNQGVRTSSVVKYAASAIILSGIIVAYLIIYRGKLIPAQPNSSKVQQPEVVGVNQASESAKEEVKESSPSVVELNKASLKIRVENGAGVSGTAGKFKEYLTNKGYNVVEIGNSDNFNYQNTVLKSKEDKKDYLELVKKDIGGDYTIETGEVLSPETSYDLLIIVGRK
ncbi:LytR C-terminal domain-containing protein, partial [candidate division WWE3 bacterium]|nr:LytR C-terminal domain-containing protein [candidate division WWE3 bacterium]